MKYFKQFEYASVPDKKIVLKITDPLINFKELKGVDKAIISSSMVPTNVSKYVSEHDYGYVKNGALYLVFNNMPPNMNKQEVVNYILDKTKMYIEKDVMSGFLYSQHHEVDLVGEYNGKPFKI